MIIFETEVLDVIQRNSGVKGGVRYGSREGWGEI
jgi:hypothetical protein